MQDEGPSHEHNQNDASIPPLSVEQNDVPSPHEQVDGPAPPSPPGQNDASTHEPNSTNNTRNLFQVEEEINWEEVNLIQVKEEA